MSTDRQIAANRANSQSSTGPITLEGKLASSRNSLKSGIYSKAMIIRGENQADLDLLIAEFIETWQPTAADERSLVDTLITNEWLLRRLRNAEAQIWEECMAHAQTYRSFNPDTALGDTQMARERQLTALQRRITTLERSFHRALRDLAFLQKSRRPVQPADSKPKSPKMASFPQNPVPVEMMPSPVSQTPPEVPASEASQLKADS